MNGKRNLVIKIPVALRRDSSLVDACERRRQCGHRYCFLLLRVATTCWPLFSTVFLFNFQYDNPSSNFGQQKMADTSGPKEETERSRPVDLTAPYDPEDISGKTILITGGASGFGAAFAKKWATHGAHIMIGDIDDAAGEALVAQLRSSTGSEHHHFQHCDVTDWQSQVSLFKMAARLSPTGGIDAVVPNAGIGDDGAGPGKGFEYPQSLDGDNPPPPRLKVLDVNLTGVMYTIHLALFWLPRNGSAKKGENGPAGENGQPSERQRDRHILLIGSIASLIPLVGSPQYTASKHAITGLFRTLRGTAFRKGIRINMLCPYFVDTNILANFVMLFLAGGGLGELEDVVDAGTRFMADRNTYGRAVIIGPRMKVEDGEDGDFTLVEIPKEGEDGKGIWECYAHDYEHVEAFVYRYTRLLLAFAKLRGWIGWATDVLWILFVRRTGKQ
jgi:NAD(P)-dependent dehydrogenase (short-subunit alcohol dehydrogenase family)